MRLPSLGPARHELVVATLLTACIGSLALTTAAGTSAPADENWPQWRGPLENGAAPGSEPVIEWSEDDNIAWKTPLPGLGSATPVVWGNRIFVLSAVPVETDAAAPDPVLETALPSAVATAEPGGPRLEEPLQRRFRGGFGARRPTTPQEFTVLAVDRADGSVLWKQVARRQVPHEGKHQTNSYASGSAITDGELVIAFFGSHGLYAYDLEGNLLWDKDLGDMRTRLGFGEGTSPALFGDTLVVNWDHEDQSFIVALDKSTGRELWRQDRDEPTSWTTPLIVQLDGHAQVITGATNRVRSYDLSSGKLLWEGPGLTANAIPSPVYGDGLLYVTSGFRGSVLRAIRLAQAAAAPGDAVAWEHNRDTPYVPSPLLYAGGLYFIKSNSPILTSLDAGTGEKRYGPVRLPGIREIYASPVGAGGHVYIVGRDGGALVLQAGPEFKVLATNQLDDGFDASPAVVGDEIYLRGRHALYRISAN